VSVRVPAGEAEVARARLLGLAPGGFEEIDRGPTIELAVYSDEAGAAALAEALCDAASTPVDPGWEERWREFHRPVRAGGLWIGPPWEEPPASERAVVIDPGRAFGTGAHPTTRACIELLAAEERGSALDAGCGSGVIAIAAARLGFGPVVAVDLDEVAIEAARENIARNRVDVDARVLDALGADLPPTRLVIANIDLAAVETLLSRAVADRAITSGYLAGEAPDAAGWARVATLELEGWAADVFESA
jgi:ribosomal protein L11 methyltransferase